MQILVQLSLRAFITDNEGKHSACQRDLHDLVLYEIVAHSIQNESLISAEHNYD